MPEPLPEPSLHQVMALIERMPRTARGRLRPWLLARFDVRGYDRGGSDDGLDLELERARRDLSDGLDA